MQFLIGLVCFGLLSSVTVVANPLVELVPLNGDGNFGEVELNTTDFTRTGKGWSIKNLTTSELRVQSVEGIGELPFTQASSTSRICIPNLKIYAGSGACQVRIRAVVDQVGEWTREVAITVSDPQGQTQRVLIPLALKVVPVCTTGVTPLEGLGSVLSGMTLPPRRLELAFGFNGRSVSRRLGAAKIVPDGEGAYLFAVGSSGQGQDSGDRTGNSIFVFRVLNDVIDTSFGDNGVFKTPQTVPGRGISIRSIRRLPNRKIFVRGVVDTNDPVASRPPLSQLDGWVLGDISFLLNEDGTPDESFGLGGGSFYSGGEISSGTERPIRAGRQMEGNGHVNPFGLAAGSLLDSNGLENFLVPSARDVTFSLLPFDSMAQFASGGPFGIRPGGGFFSGGFKRRLDAGFTTRDRNAVFVSSEVGLSDARHFIRLYKIGPSTQPLFTAQPFQHPTTSCYQCAESTALAEDSAGTIIVATYESKNITEANQGFSGTISLYAIGANGAADTSYFQGGKVTISSASFAALSLDDGGALRSSRLGFAANVQVLPNGEVLLLLSAPYGVHPRTNFADAYVDNRNRVAVQFAVRLRKTGEVINARAVGGMSEPLLTADSYKYLTIYQDPSISGDTIGLVNQCYR